MSQIPYNQPLIGPMQFVPQMFQGIPTSLPQVLQPVIGQTACILLTKAMEQAQSNPARMSAFNHLVVNNFNNPNLPPAVELTIRLAIQKAIAKNDVSRIGNYLSQAADEALLYLTSSLLVASGEMQRSCTAQAIQAAFQNNANFARVKNELLSMNLNGIGQATNQPQQMNQVAAPIFENYQNVFSSNTRQAEPASSSFGNAWSGASSPPQQQQPVSLQQAPFFNNEVSRQDVQKLPTPSMIPVVDFNLPPQEKLIPLQPVISVVTIQGENEMDIKSHAVPYFGSSDLMLDMSSRRSDLQLEALQLHREASRPETSDGPVLLNKNLLVEANLDSAVFIMSMALQQNQFQGITSKVYRQFTLILNPTACSEAAKVAMEVIMKAPSLHRVPDLFRAFLKVIKDPSNPKENELQALNFYAYLDSKLTKAVNEFLTYNLRIPDISITSFCADFPFLENYLLTNRGDQYSRALSVWSQKFFDQLKSGYSQDASGVLENYFEIDASKNIGWFPIYHSVTLLSLTKKELDYEIDDKGSMIDGKMTAMLDSLSQGLFRNKKELDLPTSIDWLMTVDDYRYRLAEDALNPGRFYMFKS